MVATRISIAEFEAMHGDDRVELIDGAIVPMPFSADGSSSLGMWIGYLLGRHVYPRNLGRLYSADGGFVLFPDRETVRIPDVAFVRADRAPQGEAREHFPRLPPDIAVEVISASDRPREIAAKVAMYQEAGVPLVWLVDRWAKTVTVFALGQPPRTLGIGDELDGGEVLPEFRVTVAEVFG
ncbi:MAG: Uma2 family endonuclease [Thermomicrobiales bacterium]